MEKRVPAGFLLINSKGHPDFIMTMLVVVILALLLVVLFWIGLNMMVLMADWKTANAEHLSSFITGFNENAQLIILGLCSSVFSLAGAYYLRRASFDKHYNERQIAKQNQAQVMQAPANVVAGFVENEQSTLNHPNYDDEEEDI